MYKARRNECETPLVDPNTVLREIEALQNLTAEERVDLRSSLAKKCMSCVELCSVEDAENDSYLVETGSDNGNCFVRVMQATIIAASEDGSPDFEDALMFENRFEVPDIDLQSE